MEKNVKQNLNLKSVIGMSYLSKEQAIKYLDHPNYKLRGSVVVLIDDFNVLDGIQDPIASTLLDIVPGLVNTIVRTDNWKKLWTPNRVLIIFKEEKPAFVVY